MIRVVLAVALAAALLATSVPAVDGARADRTAALLDAELDDVREAATTLVDHEDPTGSETAGARRVVVIDVPQSSWTTAGVDSVTVTGSDRRPSERDATLEYTLENGRERYIRLDVSLRTPNGPLVFRGGVTYRLSLALTWGDEGPVVVAHRR